MGKLVIRRDYDKKKFTPLPGYENKIKNFADFAVMEGALVEEDTGAVVCALAIYEMRPKIWYCFLLPSEKLADHGFEAAKSIKILFKELVIPVLDWEAIVTVSKDEDRINRWMKFMGFTKTQSVAQILNNTKHYVWEVVNRGS